MRGAQQSHRDVAAAAVLAGVVAAAETLTVDAVLATNPIDYARIAAPWVAGAALAGFWWRSWWWVALCPLATLGWALVLAVRAVASGRYPPTSWVELLILVIAAFLAASGAAGAAAGTAAGRMLWK